MKTVVNAYGIRVRRWCASCGYKVVENDGTRTCRKMNLKVDQAFVCGKWRLSYDLQQAGRSGGSVRLKGTKRIII
ncbi:MAG: hypothetical protein K5764_04305 [Prevotella sp.]|nr:hypothetical protein [Prevotella sp.]